MVGSIMAEVSGLGKCQRGVDLGNRNACYDAARNMSSDGAGKTFEWDAANRLIAINYITNGNRTTFAYDGLGRRMKITEYGPGVTADVEPTDGNYSKFVAGPFTLPPGASTLTLQGLNPNGGENTMLVDSVTLNSWLVTNGSFELPSVPDYQVVPTGTGTAWSFSGTAGVAHNNGGTYNPNTTAGSQATLNRGN
jgi:YD repeat-containing protein